VSVLILKRASASRPSGEWNDDDYDVLADGVVVGRIFNAAASPVGTPWLSTLSMAAAMPRLAPRVAHSAFFCARGYRGSPPGSWIG
jgi:hypothetical protein